MQLASPVLARPSAPLARANPVAKLAAAGLVMAALFASLDGMTAAIILGGLLIGLAMSGLRLRSLVGRAWLIGIAAISIAVANVIFAPQQVGSPVVLGPLRLGTDTILVGAGLALRLLAIALAGLLAAATTDPTDLADALVQHLRVSPRFAIGVMAALRLVPLLAREWETIGLARRARGIDAGRNPLVAIRLLGGRLLALLVGAVRRASRLALAMDARGLGSLPCRTSARPQAMRRSDRGWVLAAGLLAAGAVATSIALGTWQPLLG